MTFHIDIVHVCFAPPQLMFHQWLPLGFIVHMVSGSDDAFGVV